MKLTEEKLRQIIREELEKGSAGMSEKSWRGVQADLKRNEVKDAYMTVDGESIFIDLGRGGYRIPVDKSQNPVYQ